MFRKRRVLKSFTKVHRKKPARLNLFQYVSAWRPATLLQKRHRLWEYLFFQNTSGGCLAKFYFNRNLCRQGVLMCHSFNVKKIRNNKSIDVFANDAGNYCFDFSCIRALFLVKMVLFMFQLLFHPLRDMSGLISKIKILKVW